MTDQAEIETIVRLYFDSMHESSAEKVREAFHKNAWITGYMEQGLVEMTVDNFAEFVASQQPSPKEKGDDIILEIKSCEVVGATASVKVRDGYLGMIFLDTLSFLKVNGRWKIYNKLFHVE